MNTHITLSDVASFAAGFFGGLVVIALLVEFGYRRFR